MLSHPQFKPYSPAVNKTGRIIARVLPFLLGFIFLLFLLALRLDWISEEPPAGEIRAGLSPADAELSLSLSPRGRETARLFDPGDKIYARLRLRGVAPGRHTASFHWLNPRGRIQETYEKTFMPRRGRHDCWSWLELRGADWLPVSLGPFGSARFRGRWRVRAFLDGKLLDESEFVVE